MCYLGFSYRIRFLASTMIIVSSAVTVMHVNHLRALHAASAMYLRDISMAFQLKGLALNSERKKIKKKEAGVA